MNRDRLMFYVFHGGAKPLLFTAGVVLVLYGYVFGAILSGIVWAMEILADVWYWKNFDKSRFAAMSSKGAKVPLDEKTHEARLRTVEAWMKEFTQYRLIHEKDAKAGFGRLDEVERNLRKEIREKTRTRFDLSAIIIVGWLVSTGFSIVKGDLELLRSVGAVFGSTIGTIIAFWFLSKNNGNGEKK